MLSKQRCHHTPVVNFFSHQDPYMAVGSIVTAGERTFIWRSYVPQERAGSAGDMATAEACLRHAIRSGERAGRRWRCGTSAV